MAVAQTPSIDINGDGTLNILILGTTNSIQDNFVAFSPIQIASELQSILSSDPLINLNINVQYEDIFRTKNLSTGIAGVFTESLNYFCHSLTQYYYWPENRTSRLNNLSGNNGTDWDYVVISGDPYIIAKMPGYYSLGVNKIASLVFEGGALPLLLMQWTHDLTQTNHFKEFTYRTAEGAKVPIKVVPAGLAWQSLSNNFIDTSNIHPTPNGSYLAAASIYSMLFERSASLSQYNYNDSIADIAELTRLNSAYQAQYSGQTNFISPFKSCDVNNQNLIYNHGGTSTENGILNGLQWVASANQKTLQYSSAAPINFNYGRSSMGTTHLYQIDPTKFDYSFGYPLQDDASTGLITMLYGLDKRYSSSDVETDLGTARKMINQSQLPYARNVPLRTIIAQMLEQIPGVMIYPTGDSWHLSNDVNIAIGSYIYTMLTSDCTIAPSNEVCLDPTQWRSWMAHKIGQETAWNLMYLKGDNFCNKTIQTVSSCNPYTWINGVTYYSSNAAATYTYSNSGACDSTVILNLTINKPNTTVTQSGTMLTANMQGANYQWLDCSTGTPINGAVNQSFVPSVNGNYSVIITYNGCSETSDCYSVNSLNNYQNELENKLSIYPNPTDHDITIDLGNHYENINVVLTNILGQEIMNKNYISTQRIYLQIDGTPDIYFLTINSEGKKATFKVIKSTKK